MSLQTLISLDCSPHSPTLCFPGKANLQGIRFHGTKYLSSFSVHFRVRKPQMPGTPMEPRLPVPPVGTPASVTALTAVVASVLWAPVLQLPHTPPQGHFDGVTQSGDREWVGFYFLHHNCHHLTVPMSSALDICPLIMNTQGKQ